jgi:hypothetical protein
MTKHPLAKFRNNTPIRDEILAMLNARDVITLQEICEGIPNHDVYNIKRSLSGLTSDGIIKPIEPGVYQKIGTSDTKTN